MDVFGKGKYPSQHVFKYPKAGEKNSIVSLHMYDVASKKNTLVKLGDYEYIPRIKWTNDANILSVQKMNRHQNDLKLYVINTKKNESDLLLHETNKYYIDITDDLTFLNDKKHFIWTSEKDGFNHIYLYDMKGKEKLALTRGSFDVTSFYGVDEVNELVYYQAAEKTPLQKHVYVVDFEGENKRLITDNAGTNQAQWSSTFDYFVNTYSTANQAPTYNVYDRNSNLVRSIENNEKIKTLQEEYGTSQVEFFKFKTTIGFIPLMHIMRWKSRSLSVITAY